MPLKWHQPIVNMMVSSRWSHILCYVCAPTSFLQFRLNNAYIYPRMPNPMCHAQVVL